MALKDAKTAQQLTGVRDEHKTDASDMLHIVELLREDMVCSQPDP